MRNIKELYKYIKNLLIKIITRLGGNRFNNRIMQLYISNEKFSTFIYILAFGAGQAAAIDRLAPGADAGQAAEAGLDSRCGQGAGAGRAVMEHGGVEFVGIAVEVHDRATIAGGDEAGAKGRGAGEQLINEGIFGTA